jgi:hypothetical protein
MNNRNRVIDQVRLWTSGQRLRDVAKGEKEPKGLLG